MTARAHTGMVVSGWLIASAIRLMRFEEAVHHIPELTREQYDKLKRGEATFKGNSEEGVEFVETSDEDEQ